MIVEPADVTKLVDGCRTAQDKHLASLLTNAFATVAPESSISTKDTITVPLGTMTTDAWKVGTLTLEKLHWFQNKAIYFYVGSQANRPRTVRQWLRMCWNADIFYGEVPAIKFIALISWVIAWLT